MNIEQGSQEYSKPEFNPVLLKQYGIYGKWKCYCHLKWFHGYCLHPKAIENISKPERLYLQCAHRCLVDCMFCASGGANVEIMGHDTTTYNIPKMGSLNVSFLFRFTAFKKCENIYLFKNKVSYTKLLQKMISPVS